MFVRVGSARPERANRLLTGRVPPGVTGQTHVGRSSVRCTRNRIHGNVAPDACDASRKGNRIEMTGNGVRWRRPYRSGSARLVATSNCRYPGRWARYPGTCARYVAQAPSGVSAERRTQTMCGASATKRPLSASESPRPFASRPIGAPATLWSVAVAPISGGSRVDLAGPRKRIRERASPGNQPGGRRADRGHACRSRQLIDPDSRDRHLFLAATRSDEGRPR